MPPKYSSSNSSSSRHAGPSGGGGPVGKLRLGRLSATIWENGSDERSFLNVKFARSYLDEQKKWQNSDSFSRDDLLTLAKLADQAHTFICERQSPPRDQEAA